MDKQYSPQPVYIHMLGDFSIQVGDKKISDANSQSKKTWVLLKYLITFRNRNVMPDELMSLIWSDDDSNNPSGALKTLMFRVRKLLDPLEYSGHDLIKQQRKTYVWNPLLTTIVDTDIFEKLYHQIVEADPSSSENRILELCREAIDLYKGDFLPKSNWESWVVPISAYYHSLYLKIVYTATDILGRRKDYKSIVEICKRAILIEPFDENLHYTLILSLYKNGNRHDAVQHYHDTTDTFYKKFAITPSSHFRDLFKILHPQDDGVTRDLSVVQNILNQDNDGNGSLLCEYAVFKYIYQLMRRSLSRNGNTVFLCMITLSDSSHKPLKPQFLTKAMDALNYSIQVSLRRGDTYCRFSACQYSILLPATSCENAELALKRIEKKFRSEYTRKDLSAEFLIQAVLPDQE